MKFLRKAVTAKQIATPAPSSPKKTGPFAQVEADLLQRLNKSVPFSGRIRWTQDSPSASPFDVVLNWDAGDLVVAASALPVTNPMMKIVTERTPAVLGYMVQAGTTASEASFHVQDGQLPSMARFSFSSCIPGMALIPDSYFFRDRGYEKLRHWLQSNTVPWSDREARFVWRGRLTGAGLFSCDPAQRNNPLVRQRLRLAMHAQGTRLDCKFVSTITDIEAKLLSQVGMMADFMPSHSWAGWKFAIDVDGFSNTWDNLFHRLLMGCCVLKVESQMGFRQWYYDELKPWTHFVPVAADLSDLQEKLDWCLTNDAQCQAIAAAGQQVVQAQTWERALSDAGEKIRQVAA
ncbi:glycosyl transferase family 90 [Roseinatronobacter domitianus]|nr:glycosyl transferase family 90 [Roseibaca domitiana]